MATGDRRVFDIPGQLGIASRRQLIEVGWTHSGIRHKLVTTWQEPAPGVFAGHRGGLDFKQRLVAAWLWAGNSAVLTATAALNIYRAIDTPPSSVVFVIPQAKGRSQSCALAKRHRTGRPPPVAHWIGMVPVAPPARALVDHARWTDMRRIDVEALTIACLQRRVTTPELLHAALAEAGRPWQGPVRTGLRKYLDGAWSLPEATLQSLIGVAHPPDALFNHQIFDDQRRRVGIPDAYLPGVGVAIQVHSRRYHDGWDREGNDRWAYTVQGYNAYASCGVVVLGVTPSTLQDSTTAFLAQLRQTIVSRAGLPLPAVTVKCPHDCDSINAHALLTSHSSPGQRGIDG